MVDEWWRGNSECDPWREAVTLPELGRLTARWLDGTIPCSPYHRLDPPDEETIEIIEPLVSLNELGYLTDFSQPGQLGDGWDQRASVSGFCDVDVARGLSSIKTRTPLVVLTHPPSVESLVQIPVTLNEGAPFTWLGATIPVDEMDSHFWFLLNESALRELAVSWQVHVIDPEWGRNDILWDTVVEALAD